MRFVFFFFQAEDGIRDLSMTGVQTCALPICLIARRVPEPANQGGNWRVEQRLRDRAGQVEEYLDVLARGMEHLEYALIRHQTEQRRQIDPGSKRVDRHRFLGTGHLDQAEDGPISSLAHELGVDRNKADAFLPAAEVGQRLAIGDHRHRARYTSKSHRPEPTWMVLRSEPCEIGARLDKPCLSMPWSGPVEPYAGPRSAWTSAGHTPARRC